MSERPAGSPEGVVRRWVLACAAAEAIGMSAAAGAAKAGQALVGEPVGGGEVLVALSLVVAGGLVEGIALGTGQSWAFRATHPGLRRARYVAVTVLLAGLGWAAASAPAALAGPGGGGDGGPPQGLVVLGGAGLGLVMGLVLGAVQAWALRGTALRPGQWVLANTLAWVVAMAVIFWGATTPGAEWPAWQVVLLGAATGAVAGACLGAVLGRWVPRLGVSVAPQRRGM